MSALPLTENTVIEIRIEPWAIVSSTGATLTDMVMGLWFTRLNPLHSSVYAIEAEAGRVINNVPDSLIKRAIFEASRFVDAATIVTCDNPDTAYWARIRWRYVTLKSIIILMNSLQGMSATSRKALGDFEVEYDTGNGPNSPISRLLQEIEKLEPVVLAGGCLGIVTSHRPGSSVKGANDPYRPIFSRTWIPPLEGEVGVVRGVYTPNRRENDNHSNRWYRTTSRIVPWRRR